MTTSDCATERGLIAEGRKQNGLVELDWLEREVSKWKRQSWRDLVSHSDSLWNVRIHALYLTLQYLGLSLFLFKVEMILPIW